VAGFVHVLIEQGRAENVEKALGLLDELRLAPSYDTAKRAYYQFQREARFRPILLRLSELAREIPADQACPPGQLLRTGDVAVRDLGNLPLFGPTKLVITMRALRQGGELHHNGFVQRMDTPTDNT
jgi:hypothetical protein